jgi:hypothetical protein
LSGPPSASASRRTALSGPAMRYRPVRT